MVSQQKHGKALEQTRGMDDQRELSHGRAPRKDNQKKKEKKSNQYICLVKTKKFTYYLRCIKPIEQQTI